MRRCSEFELEVKKSRFLAYVSPVANESAVKEFLEQIRSWHPQARHRVYAWRVGGFSDVQQWQRYSDDGEPAGTGGLPVLKQMDAQALTQVAVVVVRYFGGILLGTGGLSRAYGAAAAGAIEAAQPVVLQEMAVYGCVLPYALYEICKSKVHAAGHLLFDEQFAGDVQCKLACRPERYENLADLLCELGSGELVLDYLESSYRMENNECWT